MVGIIETVEKVMKKHEDLPQAIYSMVVYRYDYETGRTTTVNYWRNPFLREPQDFAISSATEFDSKVQKFFPSLTRKLTLYI
jgi:hypothetical protein